jgi:hypothetical protein
VVLVVEMVMLNNKLRSSIVISVSLAIEELCKSYFAFVNHAYINELTMPSFEYLVPHYISDN